MLHVIFVLFGCIAAVTVNVNSKHKQAFIDFDKIIKEVNSGNTTWKAGHNAPRKISPSLVQRHLGFTQWKRGKIQAKVHGNSGIIPKSFDGRKNWKDCPTFGDIRDQGNCGTGWAASSAGVLSDRNCVWSNGTRKEPLSTQEASACCVEDKCGFGCLGGDPLKLWEFFRTNGLVTGGEYGTKEGCQPYSMEPCEHYVDGKRPKCEKLPARNLTCYKECTNKEYKVPFERDHVHSGNFTWYPTVEAAQMAIMTDGSIVAGMTIYSDFLVYKKGVYEHNKTAHLITAHAVRVVGWGEEDGVNYWLAANSWNTDWGDSGWFKIKRGINECSFEEFLAAGEKP